MPLCSYNLVSRSSTSSFCRLKNNLKRFYSSTVVPQHQPDDDKQEIVWSQTRRQKLPEHVGILQFIGNHPRVNAKIKTRYGDFHVHEIDLNDKIVRLTDLNPPPPDDLPKDVPFYTHCTLYKEGYAWPDVVRRMCRKLGITPTQITCAGMKDRVAKTSQRICVANVDAQLLYEMSEEEIRNDIKFGNFSYSPNQLMMSELKGNHFRLLLKNMRKSERHRFNPSPETSVTEDFEEAVESLKEFGFINYYGLQRFGDGSYAVGLALLQQDWLTALDLLHPRKDDPDFLRDCKTQWLLYRDSTHFTKTRPPSLGKFHNRIDVRVLHGLAQYYKGDTDSLMRAFKTVPASNRDFFRNALKSFLWNHVATFRLQKYGFKPVVGDFVRCVDPATETSTTVNTTTTGSDDSIVDEVDADLVDDDDGIDQSSSLVRVPPGRFFSMNVKVLTKADLSQPNCPYTIFDVLLPVPGIYTGRHYHPNRFVQMYYERVLKRNELDLNCFLHFHNVCRAEKMGLLNFTNYRPLVVKPVHVQSKIVPYTYEDDLDKLIPSDFDLLSCPDGEIFSQIQLPTTKRDNLEKTGGQMDRICSVLEFSLPVSSYATMALREILIGI